MNDGNIETIKISGELSQASYIDQVAKTDIVSVYIGDTVTSIGEDAFYKASALTSITIPEGVITSIEKNAFNYSGLTSITIPASVESIGNTAFYKCDMLISVTFTENSSLNSIGIYGLSNTKITSIDIPASVTSIGERAFEKCTQLSTVTFAESSELTSIEAYLFYECTELTSINIPASVTSIGKWTFGYANKLPSIEIPDSVTSILDYAFSGCSELSSVTFADNSQLTSIGSKAFRGALVLTSIIIPTDVTSIGSDAFISTGLQTAYVSQTTIDSVGLVYGTNGTIGGKTGVNIIKTQETISMNIQPGLNIIYTFDSGTIQNVNVNTNVYNYNSGQYTEEVITDNSISVTEKSAYFLNNQTDSSYTISYNYDIELPETFSTTVNSGWNIIGWNSSNANLTATISSSSMNIQSNTLQRYEPSTNTFILITDNNIQANIGYWIKCNNNDTTITITPNSSSNIIMNTDSLRIDISKYELNSKPSFTKRNNTITNSNLHFMLLEWYYNKEMAIFMYGNIENWNVSQVTSFEKLFYFMPTFNENISSWNTSNVTNMSYMFYNCTQFNHDITNWNIEKVTNFKGMFRGINQEFINNYDINKNIDEFGNPNKKFFINNTI
jgi:surface protein